MVSPTSLVTKEFIKKDPLGITFLGLKKLNALNISKDFKLEDNYIVSKDGKNLLLFIEPKNKSNDTKNNEVFIDRLNEIKTELNKKFAGKSEISYFGSLVIAFANAQQIKKRYSEHGYYFDDLAFDYPYLLFLKFLHATYRFSSYGFCRFTVINDALFS